MNDYKCFGIICACLVVVSMIIGAIAIADPGTAEKAIVCDTLPRYAINDPRILERIRQGAIGYDFETNTFSNYNTEWIVMYSIAVMMLPTFLGAFWLCWRDDVREAKKTNKTRIKNKVS